MTRAAAGEPEFTGPEEARRWRAARRAALDHVLALVADAPWSEGLVLRGSMAMTAWVGDLAREPGDLDFVVREQLAVPVDPLDPWPYVDGIEAAQQWPEAAGGAAAGELWQDQEWGTGGLRAVPPPEGLAWIPDPETRQWTAPYGDLCDRIARQPQAARGVVLDAAGADEDRSWTYAVYDTPGVRLAVPWRADGLPPGEVTLDFARDEPMPDRPVLTLVPRADDRPPSVVWTASRELSLAWKLLWLHTDWATGGRSRGKDLYDAVLLAEADRTVLPPRLLRRVMHRAADLGANGFHPGEVAEWEVDWAPFRAAHPQAGGTAGQWLARLTRALEPVFESLAAEGAATGGP